MKKFVIGLLVSVLFIAGYFRDYVFIHLNGQLYITRYSTDQTPMPTGLEWIESLTYNEAYILKWILTIIFTFLFFALSALLIRIYFNQPRYIKYTAIIFLVFFSVALLVFLSGYILGNNALAYTISRNIMGWVQSPVMLMLIFPILYLHHKKMI